MTSRRLCGGGQIVPLYNWYNHLSQEEKKSLDGKENSKHYMREQGASLMQPTLFSRRVTNLKSLGDYVNPIQEAIDDLLFPTLFGQMEPLPSDLRQLVTLTPTQGGLGLPDSRFEAPQQFAAST
ncbi:unnamed protein product [Porites lobata]|uniref:Uncharacterized protein n=1 Tax=Porites lobata TaxID=104759 RepID=A0ABN8NAC2_9CNID|nr:unnamed protein product [Porites lobata]